MPHMLFVTALEFGDPVAALIDVIADYRALHRDGSLRLLSAHRPPPRISRDPISDQMRDEAQQARQDERAHQR
jgi:hypothetical protein